MIKIDGIRKIVGCTAGGRIISDIAPYENDLGEPFYVFTFEAMDDGEDWNKKTEVRLSRKPKTFIGDYELFVMGLHVVTVRSITIDKLRSPMELLSEIHQCMKTAKNWWDMESYSSRRIKKSII